MGFEVGGDFDTEQLISFGRGVVGDGEAVRGAAAEGAGHESTCDPAIKGGLGGVACDSVELVEVGAGGACIADAMQAEKRQGAITKNLLGFVPAFQDVLRGHGIRQFGSSVGW